MEQGRYPAEGASRKHIFACHQRGGNCMFASFVSFDAVSFKGGWPRFEDMMPLAFRD